MDIPFPPEEPPQKKWGQRKIPQIVTLTQDAPFLSSTVGKKKEYLNKSPGCRVAVALKTDTKCITPKQSAIHKIIVEVDRLTVDCIVIFCIIDVCIKNYVNYLIYGIVITSLLLPYKRKNRFQHIFVCICLCSVSRLRLCKGIG